MCEDLSNIKSTLDNIEALLRPLMSKPLEESLEGLSTFEKAKLKTALSYAIVTLQLVYLRSSGTNVENHNNRKYLERLKAHFTKLDKCIDLSSK